jgi:hypothetical protein
MPHRLIGRTADFGSVSLGSSPSGATKQNPRSDAWFFYSRVSPSLLERKRGKKKETCEERTSAFFALGQNANAEGPPLRAILHYE